MSGLRIYGQTGPELVAQQNAMSNNNPDSTSTTGMHTYGQTRFELLAQQNMAMNPNSNPSTNMDMHTYREIDPALFAHQNAALNAASGVAATTEVHSTGLDLTLNTQDELIMNLRIQIAIMQNDLQHTRHENDTLKSSLNIVIRSLGQGQGMYRAPLASQTTTLENNSPSTTMETTGSYTRAVQENTKLRAQLQQLIEARQVNTPDEARTTTTPEQGAVDLSPANWWTGPRPPFQDDSFKTETTNPFSFSSRGDPDIGMKSLEEVFGEDGASAAGELDFGSSSKEFLELCKAEEHEKDIDEQLAGFQKDLLAGKAAPTPSILKTGFELKGFLGDTYIHSLPIPVRNGENYDKSKSRHDQNWSRFPVNAPIGPRAQRTVENHDGLYEDEQERGGVLRTHMKSCDQDDHLFPAISKREIAYVPAAGDVKFLRTIHICNLPASITLRDILNRVRGGDVLSAILLNTIKVLGSMSARIVFRDEKAAEEYVSWTKVQPICFPAEDGEEIMIPAIVELINTPTFPGFRDQHGGITRCLSIPNIPTRIRLRQMEQDLIGYPPIRADGLVEWFLDENQTLHLQFSSTGNAEQAFGILARLPIYRGCDIQRAEDPCSGPIQELLEEPKPRPPMFPRNWNGFKADGAPGDGGESVGGVDTRQRKRLAAVTNQKVEIPSFSGTALKGPSWADEVEDEEVVMTSSVSPSSTLPAVLVNSPENGEVETLTNSFADVDALTKNNPGLAGSRWAFKPTNSRPRAGSNYFSNQKTPEAIHSQNFTLSRTKASVRSDSESLGEDTDRVKSFQTREIESSNEDGGFRSPPQTCLDNLLASSSSDEAKSVSSSDYPKSRSLSPDEKIGKNLQINRTYKKEDDDVFTPERQPIGPPATQTSGSLSYFKNGTEELEKVRLSAKNPDEIDLELNDEDDEGDEREEMESPTPRGKGFALGNFIGVDENGEPKLLKAESPYQAFISAYSAGAEETSNEKSKKDIKVEKASSTSSRSVPEFQLEDQEQAERKDSQMKGASNVADEDVEISDILGQEQNFATSITGDDTAKASHLD